MTCLHCPDGEASLPLHVPPLPGLAGHVEGDGAGVLAQVADLPPLLGQTQDVLRVENRLLTEATDLSDLIFKYRASRLQFCFIYSDV